jgi:hypothetical protein
VGVNPGTASGKNECGIKPRRECMAKTGEFLLHISLDILGIKELTVGFNLIIKLLRKIP